MTSLQKTITPALFFGLNGGRFACSVMNKPTRGFIFRGFRGRERGQGWSCFPILRFFRRVTSLLTVSRFDPDHPAFSEDGDRQRSCPACCFCGAGGAVVKDAISCGSIGSCSLSMGSSSRPSSRLSVSTSTGSCSLSIGGAFYRDELEAAEFRTATISVLSAPSHRAGRDGQGELIYLLFLFFLFFGSDKFYFNHFGCIQQFF